MDEYLVFTIRSVWWGSGKLPKEARTAWRHETWHQTPGQEQCICVAPRCSFDLRNGFLCRVEFKETRYESLDRNWGWCSYALMVWVHLGF